MKHMPRTLDGTFRFRLSSILPHAIAGGLFGGFMAMAMVAFAQEANGLHPNISHAALQSVLPADARLLDDAAVIERFLEALDGSSPNWNEIYGDHGVGHDERLYALNRKRDQLRKGRDELTSRLTFLWTGELSRYDLDLGAFHVAMGPKLILTRWGIVRFKPDDLPSNLVAVPPPTLSESLQERVSTGKRVEIDVAITGRLLLDESIIYDFAHDEPGHGMVMPVVRVERIDYVLNE